VLVWGAWREALDRALAAHRAAAGRHAELVAQLRVASHHPMGHLHGGDQVGIDAAADAVTASAGDLPGGWLGLPWPDLAAARPPIPPGAPPAPTIRDAGRVVVRIGTGSVSPPGASCPRTVPIHVPLLGLGHLTIDGDIHDPQVAGVFRTVLLRLLAGLPAGRIRVLPHDPAGLGQVFSPLRPLIEAGIVAEPGGGRSGLAAALDEAEAQVRRAWHSPELERPFVLLALAGLAPGSDRELDVRLAALAHAGPAAGVGLLVAQWPPPGRTDLDPPPVLDAATALTRRSGCWWITLPGAREPLDLPVDLDPAPPAELVDAVCRPLAAAAARADHLSFDDLLTDELWAHSSADGLATPIGRAVAAGRPGTPEVLHLDDTTPHWLVGGRSGSGKTVFLLDVLAGLTARYPPSELALYLLDFKEGVSFSESTPTPHDPTWIPHAVAVGVESDREYGVAVLRALGAEMARRALAFKRAGVASLGQLRRAVPDVVPRVVAVIDEFQVLFAGNDPVAREATELLEDVARRGRSYGVHLVLASQTTSGIEALQTKLEAIFGQFPMRIALPGGSGVLDPLNPTADGLGVGTAVVNPAGGIKGADIVVRVPFAEPDAVTALRRRLWDRRPAGSRPPAVFAGFETRHLDDDPAFARLSPDAARPTLLLGRRIDVDASTATVPLDATPGRHLAVLGPSAVGADVLHAALAALGRQHLPGRARFVVAPLVPAGDRAAEQARAALAGAGHEVETVALPALGRLIASLAGFEGCTPERPTYLALFGADAASPALGALDPDTFRPGTDDLRAVVQQGPLHGVHVLGWWRGLARFAADLGPDAREDVACLVVLNVPGAELQSFLGRFDLHWDPRPNRALLLDRHEGSARVIVPFVDRQRVLEGVS
jgi:hypothetical protein